MPDPTDAEKIRAIEAHYQRCWACIQADIWTCQHYHERPTSDLEQITPKLPEGGQHA